MPGAMRFFLLAGCPSDSSLHDEFFRLHRGECSMRRTAILAILLCLPSVTIAHAEDLFDIRPMADGVYAAIAKPAYKVNCNAAIILLDLLD